jgi:purine-binding chemotaxis protein CheW
MELCTFKLSGRLFGVEIGLVKEVVQHVAIAPVPHALPDVAGLVNIRGRLHLVADLRRLFGFSSEPERKDACIVLFKPSVDEALGVHVDSLGDVVSMDPAMIEDRRAGETSDGASAPDERRKARQGLALGVGRTAAGLLVLLDPNGILQTVQN